MRELFISWQNPDSREWKPIGVLDLSDGVYRFRYTQGAKDSSFHTFETMTSLDAEYLSEDLLPFLKNRLMSKSRPDYERFMSWLNLDDENDSPFNSLARSGGIRATDTLQFFEKPQNNSGQFIVDFFVHGISHLPSETLPAINQLDDGAQLFPMLDNCNNFDQLAVALRTDDPVSLIGYVPRPFAPDFREILKYEGATIRVVKINESAPLKFRLLAKIIAPWPQGFEAFNQADFQVN